jgi:hypothetical protein
LDLLDVVTLEDLMWLDIAVGLLEVLALGAFIMDVDFGVEGYTHVKF